MEERVKEKETSNNLLNSLNSLYKEYEEIEQRLIDLENQIAIIEDLLDLELVDR